MNDLAPVESLLAQIVDESVGPDTEAIVLGGSYARGAATQFSDLDIAHFVVNLPPTPQKRLFFRSGILVTIGQKSLAQERAALALPERAITLVPAYRELRILYDPHGALARFIADVQSFQWEPLQSKANAYTSAMLMLTTETPFKIASALDAENTGATAYETAQIVLALARFVAVQHGVLIRTNSTFMGQVHQAMGISSDWTRLHRIAGGMVTLTGASPTLEVRALAAMRLFAETANALQNILALEHRQVVMDAAQFARVHVARHPASEHLLDWLSRIADEQP